MLLRDIVEQNHAHFIERAENWEDSIRQSCKLLIADGTVTEAYPEEIIDCVKTNGPYIVLMPGFALPHSMENSKNAHGTAIAFMKVKDPVFFDVQKKDPGGPQAEEVPAADVPPVKSATVFFTLAAVDSEHHLLNMRKLWKMLTDEALCADLLKAESVDDLLELDKKYTK
ncbi:MAG: PTS sugar transporter subunit IIA [Treponema sp.]|jgi:PTS system ascorbate-specific IIA component|nr:PTS sugar transporter subunit IIA [Treponema sp.]